MLSQDDAKRVENYLHPDQRPLQELLLFQIAESVQSTREHTHPSRGEDLYCLNQVAWRGERMGAVLKRLLDESAEARRLTAVLDRVESVLNELRRNPEPGNANDLHGLGRRVMAQLEAALYLESEAPESSTPEPTCTCYPVCAGEG